MSLSLCMIVKNEELSLPKCLGSVKNIVNEIVVVDTGSTDKTPKIARQFGAKVYDFVWCDDFSMARNEALKYVTGKWVLVLDADETLKPEILPQLKAAIATEKYILINLIRQELGSVQSPYSLVSRLFRSHANIKFNRPYHALVDDSITEIIKEESCWKIGYLSEVAIIHSGYQKAVIDQQNKYSKAITAMAKFYKDHPDDVYLCSKLGGLYVEMGKISQGLKLLYHGLSLILENRHQGENISNDILYELHYHLGITHGSYSSL
jgi:glycosyltransferase involved in cell wall biosynthesis